MSPQILEQLLLSVIESLFWTPETKATWVVCVEKEETTHTAVSDLKRKTFCAQILWYVLPGPHLL